MSAGYTRHTCPRANFYVEHLGPGGVSPEASCRLPPPPALPPKKEAAMLAPWAGKWGFSNPSFHEVYTFPGLYVGSGFCLVPAGHLKPRPWVSKCHFHFSILPELRTICSRASNSAPSPLFISDSRGFSFVRNLASHFKEFQLFFLIQAIGRGRD